MQLDAQKHICAQKRQLSVLQVLEQNLQSCAKPFCSLCRLVVIVPVHKPPYAELLPPGSAARASVAERRENTFLCGLFSGPRVTPRSEKFVEPCRSGVVNLVRAEALQDHVFQIAEQRFIEMRRSSRQD